MTTSRTPEGTPARVDASPILLAEVEDPSIAEIGGKAASLVRLSRAGFRVPDGAVLPASWFSAWWEELEKTDAWSRFAGAKEAPWADHCEALKIAAGRFPFSDEMRAGLEELRKLVASWGDGATCAVRSSSPDEDLENASFAGGYTTILGVPGEGIEDAVRECFVSCLDERVVVYKAQHGFDVHGPRIAVLVQRQVESEVSGVGFSLNPVTNDYDEAVIDASFGLGETVVSGEVSPDHFVVDKPGRKILERQLGSKSVSRWIRPEGGVEARNETRGEQASLSDEQVLELADALGRLEEAYGHPVDIEWAYARGELHLLQARPITAYFPLSPDMQTEPGAQRRLYFDGSLTEKFTINAPLTTLTLDAYKVMLRRMVRSYRIPSDPEEKPLEDLVIFRGARMYVSYSDFFLFASPQQIATPYQVMDILLYRILENLDRDRYRPKEKPGWLAWGRLARATVGTLRGTRRMWRNTLIAFLFPEEYLELYRKAIAPFESAARSMGADASVDELHDIHERSVEVILDIDLPTIYVWFAAVSILETLAKGADPRTQELLDRMGRGFEGELVIEMGVEMFAASRLLDPREFDDLPLLAKRIATRELPEAFPAAWDSLIHRFGARGPNEMELASPRYGEDPALLLRQLSFLAKAAPENDPRLVHERHVAERRQAFAELSGRFGWFRRALLRVAHRWTEAYAGERDTAKYHWVLAACAVRRGALARGDRLVAEGRLDSRNDVFHLTFEELEAAESDAAFDVRTPALERRRSFNQLERQAKEFPHLIDSRGRILRPAPMNEEGALSGLGISPGVARGPIKVLENPYEKEIEQGDVLVAYTTDPGWTPLFINASAIILQVGGMMQHGGVVAREYGKPCVAGIEHVLTRFQDGEMVEVDGSAGVVRPLES
jgi:pyruvate,water dikinase